MQAVEGAAGQDYLKYAEWQQSKSHVLCRDPKGVREGERNSCWRRRGRQRRSRGPSLLAPRCEDCMWEEAVH